MPTAKASGRCWRRAVCPLTFSGAAGGFFSGCHPGDFGCYLCWGKAWPMWKIPWASLRRWWKRRLLVWWIAWCLQVTDVTGLVYYKSSRFSWLQLQFRWFSGRWNSLVVGLPSLATGETHPAWWHLQVTSTASSFGHLSRDRGKCQTDPLQERFGMLRFDQ